jgi:hypothetical protein
LEGKNMADIAYRNEAAIGVRGDGPNWSAVWAGTFAFFAIWSVFGSLGEEIFASAASPRSPDAVGTGIGWGISIWSIILTMVAMYVAGRVTAHFSRAQTRHDALLAGITMFGLSVVSAVVIIMFPGNTLTAGSAAGFAGAPQGRAISILTTLGWAGFASLFLGWLCAMWGSTSGVQSRAYSEATGNADTVRGIRAA